MLPDEVEPKDLHPAARNELKTLQADVQERVARHLAMVAFLIDDEPELAHQHALSASRRAGRIPVARETLAITAYRTGDFALALREFRTHRRLSGQDGHVSLMVDCERGLGRPEKAIETGLDVDASKLDTEQRVHLAIAMSGARLDLGQTQQALFELEIPELNPAKAFSWSPDLFAAYSAVLEDLERPADAAQWLEHAEHAARALQAHHGSLDELEVFEIYEEEPAAETEVSTEDDDEAMVDPADDFGDEPVAEAPVAEADEVETDDVVTEDVATDDVATDDVETDDFDAAERGDEEMSIEDEVDELLAAAGITGAAVPAEATDANAEDANAEDADADTEPTTDKQD